MIPNAFVKTYGEELSSTIFLHPPNGTEWKLNLEKHDGKIWFQKGWKEFAEHHSLAYGHLLVITYERTSHFHVHIFDKSTLEIDYPIEGKMASNEGKKSPNNPNLEHYGSSQNRKDNSPLEFPQPCKMRSNKFDKVETISKLSKATLHHTDTKCEEKTVITAKYVTALDRASSFKPRNPSFLVVMQPSYIGKHSRGLLNIPSMFCKKHFDLDKEHGDIDLLVLNVGVWPVRIWSIETNLSRTEKENEKFHNYQIILAKEFQLFCMKLNVGSNKELTYFNKNPYYERATYGSVTFKAVRNETNLF
ncbi:hypothetical protein VNO77_19641 [Canavalia gladiata]|uniref:TF-B3 domain-containing protein n=1 Tax=Canavalia gladiata TaxID=3824 RepID=A0AAN9QKM4_CANGL